MASKVNIITPTEITELHGEDTITKVTLSHIKTKETQEIEVDDVIVNFWICVLSRSDLRMGNRH